MTQVHRVAIVTPLTVGPGAVLCTIFIHALALGAMVNFFRCERRVAGLVCGGHTRIRTYDFQRVKVQRKGPDEQSKGRNDCTLDSGASAVSRIGRRAYIGLVSSIVLEALEVGALTTAANAATFSEFMHLMRIFGGQIGVAVMTRFVAVREQFHSNMLGLYVQCGSWLTDHRVRMLAGGVLRGPLTGTRYSNVQPVFLACKCGRRCTHWRRQMDSPSS
jgi:hypothetical protein